MPYSVVYCKRDVKGYRNAALAFILHFTSKVDFIANLALPSRDGSGTHSLAATLCRLSEFFNL